MKRSLIIFGLSRFAEMVARYFDAASDYEVIAFTADARFIPQTRQLAGRPVIAIEELPAHIGPGAADFHAAIEYKWLNDARAQVIDRMRALGYRPASFIHPSSAIAENAVLEPHHFIMERVVIADSAQLGEGSILFAQTQIGHGASVGAFNYLEPGVLVNRFAEIGHHCVIGSRVCLVEGGNIGAWSFLKAGQHVDAPVPAGATFHPSLRAPGYVVDRRATAPHLPPL